MDRREAIRTALGEEAPDLVLKHARLVDVLTGTVYPADVAIRDGVIAGVGDYSGPAEVDLGGRYLAPGLINAHCHVESSMALPRAYCPEELRWGVTTLITDPHEIANVCGGEGLRFLLDESEGLPINYYVQLPSCVPATRFEHAGAVLSARELAPFLKEERVLGLGELMDYPGVAACDPAVLEKLDLFAGRIVDGHAPGLTGKGLQAYAAAGVRTDHESTTWEEARDKLRAGIAVLVREGSASKNLTAILTGALREGVSTREMAFCSDDKHLADIRREGTIRHNLRLAVALGMGPVEAVAMGSLNAARIFRLPNLGAIAPGYRADLVVFEDLRDFAVSAVYKDGRPVDADALAADSGRQPGVGPVFRSVRPAPLTAAALALPDRAVQPVIEILPGQILTRRGEVRREDIPSELAAGTLRKIAVVERHHATGHVGVGLLRGYGLRHGAVGTTVAHDSHNLILVGDNDRDLLTAAGELTRVQGGYTLVRDGSVLGTLPLPAAGLMSTLPAGTLTGELEKLLTLAREAGVADGIDPFVTLSFLALPVLPELRLTDLGLFDVTAFRLVD